ARHLKRQRHWPWTLNATATHDHKRGEDVRARINILSEIPEEWRKAVGRWSLLNRGKRTLLEGEYAPDRNDEYIFYQVLIGMWPPRTLNPDDFEEVIQRLITYMHKATKEAKVHTSWVNPNQSYDEAIERFIQRTLSPSKSNRFLDSFLPFQARVAKMGVVNSLAQALLKITSPGIPDFYQGTELWDLSLVDPDNRRPVDFPLREKYLEELEPLLDDASALESRDREKELRALLDQWPDGRVKLYLTACGLRWRRAHPLLFLDGDYLPLQVEGNQSDHVVAFARHHEGKTSLTVAPRLVVPLMEPDLKWPVGPSLWEDTRILIPNNLPLPKTLVDRITHRPVALGTHNDQRALPMDQVFSIWPVALLGGEV
ncbi:MAG: malto-oligosyltrehalose synthase, partial [Nitrospinaceae bacterium]|nr:malto-oligosyltrehalose synthase [Nitrospinaceae bacterium]NIS86073.1 malto-oligosyltrehalose synthase [Nitrospinaceae bacterium]NIT82917.1 malto-oligosyltrehalose synthase [Nitrospinaceae bacterium]NIU97298.1 malto-oligosyltrehalose synthase [Nitrospinaceae bacterium]NIW06705.1 malto-oligosyltrehalose synthase [Nitrospinaceae bacterium]